MKVGFIDIEILISRRKRILKSIVLLLLIPSGSWFSPVVLLYYQCAYICEKELQQEFASPEEKLLVH